jgi:hypothetical protein
VLLGAEPGIAVLLIGAHRAAHHHERREPAPVGQLVCAVHEHARERDPALAQLVLVDGRGLAVRVLQHEHVLEQAHGGAV